MPMPKVPKVVSKAGFVLAIAIPGIALAQYLKGVIVAKWGANAAVANATKVLPS